MERTLFAALIMLTALCASFEWAYGSKIFSFTPHNGTCSGGTTLEFEGENLNASHILNITVAGQECHNVNEIVREDSRTVLRCLTRESAGGPICGNVTITFENHNESVLAPEYCYVDDHLDIQPRNSLASGGIKMNLTGACLNGLTVSHLEFMYKNQSNLGTCTRNESSSNITCKAPDMSTIKNDVSVEAQIRIRVDNSRSIPFNTMKQVNIHPDPTFEGIASMSESLSETNSKLELKGQFMPHYLSTEEIKVTFVGRPCHVVSVSNTTITCDARDLIKQLREERKQQSNYTTTAGTTTPGMTTPEKLTTSAGSKNNYVDSNTSTQAQSSSTTSATTLYATAEPGSQDPTVDLDVTVEIGNFKKTIGTVKVSLAENDNSKDFYLWAAAAGAGLVSVILIIVTVTLIIKMKKAKSLRDQPVSIAALAQAQAANREDSSPTLKQILESVVEADARGEMDRLIYPLDKLTVGKSIGSGNFGCVYEGVLEMNSDSPPLKVAIKTLQDPQAYSIDLLGFVQEAVFMKDFQHPNVLGLVGLAEKEPGVPYVILPFMEKGDLLTYVRDPAVTITLYDVIKFGADIANGMAYLSSLKFVHRDLAARNCMLDSNHCVKVADFGLCRDIYEKGYYTSDNKKKLPIRWMALESIDHGAYSTKSDVWSLGVVLWEMLTRGLTPYPGVDGWDVVNFLRRRRLPPPFFCPESLYSLMMQCWAKDPSQRPDFNTLQNELLNLIDQGPQQSPGAKSKFDIVPNLYTDLPSGASKLSLEIKKRSDSLETIDETRESLSSPTSLGKDSTPRDIMWNGIQRELSEKIRNSKLKKPKKSAPSTPEDSNKAQGENAKCVTWTETPDDSPSSMRRSKVVRNVTITIPESYSDRGVSKSAMGVYVKLVGNYEPPRKFSSPFRRLTKGHAGRASDKVKQDAKTRHSDQSRTGSPQVVDSPVASRDKPGNPTVVMNPSGDAYFELEPQKSHRISSASDDASESVRSSYTMRTSGSMGSMLDSTHPGSSFMNATGISSGGDSFLSLAHPNSGKPSRCSSQNNMCTHEVTSL